MSQQAAFEHAAGEIISDRYRLEKVLGRGGMGVVWRATHVTLRETVAVKLLRVVRPEARARFLREARIAARLTSLHAARVRDAGTLPTGEPYLVFDLLHGRTLAEILSDDGPRPEGEAVRWVVQACDAVAEAHALGVVHRDLKPSNLFLSDDPDGASRVKVLDFGISKARAGDDDPSLTDTHTVMGSPRYMSPEQVRDAKRVDARSDVWSLGVVLYELVAGRPPFEAGSSAGVVARVVADPPAPLHEHAPDVSAALASVVARCLEKDPDRRFASIADLVDALAPPGSREVETAAIARRAHAWAHSPPAETAPETTLDPLSGGPAPPEGAERTVRDAAVRRPRRRTAASVLVLAGALTALGGYAATRTSGSLSTHPAPAAAASAPAPASELPREAAPVDDPPLPTDTASAATTAFAASSTPGTGAAPLARARPARLSASSPPAAAPPAGSGPADTTMETRRLRACPFSIAPFWSHDGSSHGRDARSDQRMRTPLRRAGESARRGDRVSQ